MSEIICREIDEYVYEPTGEEIVRCRDCKHWQPWMKGAEPECWANGEPFSTPPDGFCAWGERNA